MMKKILLAIALLLLLHNPVFATDWTQDADCQGAWLFNEGSGTSVADSSQNTNTGTFKGNGEPAWNDSIIGSHTDYSVLYDGTNDYITAGTSDTIFLTGNPQTTVAWIEPTSIGESIGGYFFYRTAGAGKAMGWRLTATNTLRFFNDGSTQLSVTADNNQYTLGNPLFASLSWDGSTTASNVHIYVNGVEVSGYQTQQNGSNLGSNSGATTVIGNSTTDGNNTVDGLLGEMATFSVVLDSTDINDIMDNGLVQAAPPSYSGWVTIITN